MREKVKGEAIPTTTRAAAAASIKTWEVQGDKLIKKEKNHGKKEQEKEDEKDEDEGREGVRVRGGGEEVRKG